MIGLFVAFPAGPFPFLLLVPVPASAPFGPPVPTTDAVQLSSFLGMLNCLSMPLAISYLLMQSLTLPQDWSSNLQIFCRSSLSEHIAQNFMRIISSGLIRLSSASSASLSSLLAMSAGCSPSAGSNWMNLTHCQNSGISSEVCQSPS